MATNHNRHFCFKILYHLNGNFPIVCNKKKIHPENQHLFIYIYIYIKHTLHLTNLPQTTPFCLKNTQTSPSTSLKRQVFGSFFGESPLTRLQFVASPRPRRPYTPGAGGESGREKDFVGIYMGATYTTRTPPED